MDVAPTIAEDVGLLHPLETSGYPRGQVHRQALSSPDLTAADGLGWKTIIPEHEGGRPSEQRNRAFDGVLFAGWDGDAYVMFDAAEDRVRSYDLRRDSGELTDIWPTRSPELVSPAAEVRSSAGRMAEHSPVSVPEDVEEPLQSWGYI